MVAFPTWGGVGQGGGVKAIIYGWCTGSSAVVPVAVAADGTVQTSSSGGGGGGAVTVADGADVALGATTDAANITGAAGTISGKLRGLVQLLASVISGGAVNVSAANPIAVTGTFWQSTQPISAAALPLPTNAAQETGGNLAAIASQSGFQAYLAMTQLAEIRAGRAAAAAMQNGFIPTPEIFQLGAP